MTAIRQKDIANACDVHISTVCLALADSPKIPAPTRQRVQEMALKLSYQPNASARNLAYRRCEKKELATLPIAWINQESQRDFWRTEPDARRLFEGARVRAAELGYYLDEFWVHEPGMRLSRLIQIITARGIHGVVFPIFQRFDFSFLTSAWAEFSNVSINDYRMGKWCDVVCPDHYHNMDLVLNHLRRQDTKRIGLVLDEQFDASTCGISRSCYLRFQESQNAEARLPVCLLNDGATSEQNVARWYYKYSPDSVICRDSASSLRLAALCPGIRTVQLHGASTCDVTRVDERLDEIAATAIDYLTEKIRRSHKGLGINPQVRLLKGLLQLGGVVEAPSQAVA